MMEKQQKILQMTKDICRHQNVCNDVCKPISACDALRYAERAVEAGYCKQSEGEWIGYENVTESKRGRTIHSTSYKCSLCGARNGRKRNNFCSNCGAKMKGGDGK